MPNLRIATLFAIVGSLYAFSLRLVSTIYPELITSHPVAVLVAGSHTVAVLLIAVFFHTFRRDYVGCNNIRLARAATFAMIGVVLAAFPNVWNIILMMNPLFVPQHPVSSWIQLFIPLMGAGSAIYFFHIFLGESAARESKRILSATRWAQLGSFVMVLIHALTIVHIGLRSSTGIPVALSPWYIVALMIFTLSFLTIVHFFIVFYQEQSSSINSPH